MGEINAFWYVKLVQVVKLNILNTQKKLPPNHDGSYAHAHNVPPDDFPPDFGDEPMPTEEPPF